MRERARAIEPSLTWSLLPGSYPGVQERYLPFPYSESGSPVRGTLRMLSHHRSTPVLARNVIIISSANQDNKFWGIDGLEHGGRHGQIGGALRHGGLPYSASAREDLEWRGVDFVEYDVEKDREAYERMLELTGGNRTVPVIVEEDKPVRIGWMGQGCFV